MKVDFAKILNDALARRSANATGPRREFHGPVEGVAGHFSRELAIDRYGKWAWVTCWGELTENARREIAGLLAPRFQGGVWIDRPEQRLPPMPQLLFGDVPAGQFTVQELGISYWIQMREQRHPGLFLDHAPLRQRLMGGSEVRGKTVLNTFAYTGSLSLAAGVGGASAVLTLDLSRPTIDWAKQNWELNQSALTHCAGDFIFGDTFEWLEKFRKKGRNFDVIILDPPSFSRAGNRRFSTDRDLVELHRLAVERLSAGGVLISSINSAKISRKTYETEVTEAFQAAGRKFSVLETISVGREFTGTPVSPRDSYLKGWIARASSD